MGEVVGMGAIHHEIGGRAMRRFVNGDDRLIKWLARWQSTVSLNGERNYDRKAH